MPRCSQTPPTLRGILQPATTQDTGRYAAQNAHRPFLSQRPSRGLSDAEVIASGQWLFLSTLAALGRRLFCTTNSNVFHPSRQAAKASGPDSLPVLQQPFICADAAACSKAGRSGSWETCRSTPSCTRPSAVEFSRLSPSEDRETAWKHTCCRPQRRAIIGRARRAWHHHHTTTGKTPLRVRPPLGTLLDAAL